MLQRLYDTDNNLLTYKYYYQERYKNSYLKSILTVRLQGYLNRSYKYFHIMNARHDINS